jgi:hypothetical protein
MTDQELENEVDRLTGELIDVIDGQSALASDLALVDVLAAGCTDVGDCQRIMVMTIEALSDRIVELVSGTEVLH